LWTEERAVRRFPALFVAGAFVQTENGIPKAIGAVEPCFVSRKAIRPSPCSSSGIRSSNAAVHPYPAPPVLLPILDSFVICRHCLIADRGIALGIAIRA